MTKPLIELVEEYGEKCQLAYTWNGTPEGVVAMCDRDAILFELRTRLEALERDAARYRWLEDGGLRKLPYDDNGCGPEFDISREAIDAAMEAAK